MKRYFGGGATQSTAKPSRKVRVSLISKADKGRRAQSEPLKKHDQDIEMGRPTSESFNIGRRAQSVPLSFEMNDVANREESATIMGSNNDTQVETEQRVSRNNDNNSNLSNSNLRPSPPPTIEIEPINQLDKLATDNRPPSPAPTDVLEGDSQEIMAKLPANVKVHDFAYAPPYRAVNSRDTIAYATTATSVRPRPVTEMFDSVLAISEVEYRWSQIERKRAIQGKTLRRLLIMCWITEKELAERGAPMDFEALKEYDSRPQYPWKPLGPKRIPCVAERHDIMRAHLPYWAQVEKNIRRHEYQVAQNARDQKLIELSLKEQTRRSAEYAAQWVRTNAKGKDRERSPESLSGRGKRRFVEDSQQVAGQREGGSSGQRSGAPKRRRLTPPIPPELQQPGYLVKQFPAGRTTVALKPTIQRTSSQLLRADTPPLDPEDPPDQQNSPPRGQPLIHPKHQKRGLTRQQTFVSLVR